MYNMHKELNEFYNDHVRLKDERKKLTEHRDVNLARLKDGLKALGYPSSFKAKDQGSYAMDTINKHPDKKYDLDEAVIFEKDDLPSNPADARKRIEEAMNKAGGNFSDSPKAKTNAVRVSYKDGHHVDFAIYRKNVNAFNLPIIEHAGPEWLTRDPVAINNWFNDSVNMKSPSKVNGAVVEDNQLRRIVRWLKMFAKSRESWNLPGGLIISTLVVECYITNFNRDDSSLYDTLASIRDRLKINKEVLNPTDLSLSLTSRDKDKTRVKNFEEKLDIAIEKLFPLFDSGCNETQALQAWNWLFQHSYWDGKIGESLKSSISSGSLTVTSSGLLGNNTLRKDDTKSIPVPNTRFFGG